MYPIRVPRLLQDLFASFTWRVSTHARVVHLSFDDGPIPEVTPWVLDRLAEYGAKASFFCIGCNAESHPGLLRRIIEEGHTVGNHTWDHPRGRRTRPFTYYRSILRCQSVTGSTLFRPPYGSLTMRQARTICKRFRVVFWEVLSGDFDARLSGEQCVNNVLHHVRPGSIVVFHDSLKAADRLRYALPRILRELQAEGYEFRSLAELKGPVPLR